VQLPAAITLAEHSFRQATSIADNGKTWPISALLSFNSLDKNRQRALFGDFEYVVRKRFAFEDHYGHRDYSELDQREAAKDVFLDILHVFLGPNQRAAPSSSVIG